MKGIKKIIGAVLTVVMLLGVVPMAHAANPFTDVPAGSWYAEYVDYVYEHGLMSGTSDTTFNPNSTMTRAMLVTVMYRLAGEPECAVKTPFTDVSKGKWYTNAVNWAYENKVIEGVSDTRFAPGSRITREQMVTILFRYCKMIGLNCQGFSDFHSYDDAGDVSAYAERAFGWALNNGVVKGTSKTTLAPKNSSTRAQCAAVLQRYVEWSESEDFDKPTEPTDPVVPTEPIVPDPTDPVDPDPTEPPHEHKWEHHHHDEVGHWGEGKFVCTVCGWTCSESEAEAVGLNLIQYWGLYHQEIMYDVDTENQHSYRTDADWVVDQEAYDEWVCTECGAVTYEDPDPKPQPPHVHSWTPRHCDEVGHWDEIYFFCDTCDWCCTLSDIVKTGMDPDEYWWKHHGNPMHEKNPDEVHRYTIKGVWVVEQEEHDEWVCYECGAVSYVKPNFMTICFQ